MIENTFTAVLTFALLIGGTLAIGSEMPGIGRSGAPVEASRVAMAPAVVLPVVEVTGRRAGLKLASTAGTLIGNVHRVE
jgi:hypothetical protein